MTAKVKPTPEEKREQELKEAKYEGYTQAYLYSGKVTHLVHPSHSLNGYYPLAMCGQMADPFNPWFGTGSQQEYDEAVRRPLCRKCLHQ